MTSTKSIDGARAVRGSEVQEHEDGESKLLLRHKIATYTISFPADRVIAFGRILEETHTRVLGAEIRGSVSVKTSTSNETGHLVLEIVGVNPAVGEEAAVPILRKEGKVDAVEFVTRLGEHLDSRAN